MEGLPHEISPQSSRGPRGVRVVYPTLPPLPEEPVEVEPGLRGRGGRGRGGGRRGRGAQDPSDVNEELILMDLADQPGGRGRGGRARGGRGRGGRGRGGGGRGRGAEGPFNVNEELILMDLADLPAAEQLEVPLHASRKRKWRPSTRPGTSAAGPSTRPGTSSAEPSTRPGTSAAGSSTRPSLETSTPMASLCASGSGSVQVPSPAMCLERGGSDAQSTTPDSPSSLPRRRRPPSPTPHQTDNHPEDIEYFLNLGSESDDSDTDTDEENNDLLPRYPITREMRREMEWIAFGSNQVPDEPEHEREPEPDMPQPDMAQSDMPQPDIDVPASATDQPSRLFDFDWKEFPTVPIPSASRRETFSQNNVGPTVPCVDPYDIFMTIWDRQIMEHIASETNKYVEQVKIQLAQSNNLYRYSRIHRWHPTSVDELYVFFGLVLTMGIVVKSKLEEYWITDSGESTDSGVFCTPGFNKFMSKNRFLLLTRFLHFNDNEDMHLLQLGTSEAKLFKIKPIVSHLNTKFASMYTPTQNIALDESLLLWKGWSEISQLIPNKAAKLGIKTYEICESQTGYLWRFDIHSHKAVSRTAQSEDPLDAVTPATVLRLVHGLEHKGYTLWMDNYYNSPCLARRLKCLGFDCVGTLRTNRKFVPPAIQDLTKDEMSQGQIGGLTAGDVDIMVYKDRSKVALITTYHGNTTSRHQGTLKPTVVLDYNIMMGGVDKKDQMLSQYPIERKRTKVWYKKLFRRLLNISVLNSYVIHCTTFALPSFSSSSVRLSHRSFRFSLIHSLLTRHHRPTGRARPAAPVLQHNQHRLELTQLMSGTRRNERLRRKCAVCKKRVTTVCVGCNKAVCLQDCFKRLHCP